MKLYYSVTSPFARKIRMAIHLLKLEAEVQLELVDVYGPAAAQFKKINPLIKIPAFEMQDGHLLTNSPFIFEYVNQVGRGHLLSPQGDERWQQLNMQSQADGLIEAAVLRLYESRRRPHLFDSEFDKKQKSKIENAVEFFEQNLSLLRSPNDSPNWTVAEVSLICALEYLDFRFAKDQFLAARPRLKLWQSQAQKQNCVLVTKPQ
jgi:glutathione S-transferase